MLSPSAYLVTTDQNFHQCLKNKKKDKGNISCSTPPITEYYSVRKATIKEVGRVI